MSRLSALCSALGLCFALGACSSMRWENVAANWVAQGCSGSGNCRLSCPPDGTPKKDVPLVCRSDVTNGARERTPPH